MLGCVQICEDILQNIGKFVAEEHLVQASLLEGCLVELLCWACLCKFQKISFKNALDNGLLIPSLCKLLVKGCATQPQVVENLYVQLGGMASL